MDKKQKVSLILTLLFLIANMCMPFSAKKVQAYENKVELIYPTRFKTNLEKMTEHINQIKEKREYEQKLQARENQIKCITASNNRKNSVTYNESNLLIISNINTKEMIEIFKILNKNNMIDLAQAFVDAEKEYGVNALFLAGLVAHESYWANKPAGNGSNLTGMGVYSPESSGFDYDSRYDNIMSTAKILKEKYLTPNGAYYRGLAINDVNYYYCLIPYSNEVDYKWSQDINLIAYNLCNIYHTEIKEIEKMPEEIKPLQVSFLYK